MTGYTLAELVRDYGERWIITIRPEGFRASHRAAWPPVVFTGETAAELAGQLKEWEDRRQAAVPPGRTDST